MTKEKKNNVILEVKETSINIIGVIEARRPPLAN